MPFFLLASFPNSRVKPRPATQDANTYHVALDVDTNPVTLVAPPNANRTYIILKNLSDEGPFWYVYATVVLANPSVTPTLGVKNQLVLFVNQLYQKQDEGQTTNWTAVNIAQVGESVDALQAASLDQIGDAIYAAYPAGPTSPVVIAVDEGRG